MTLENKLLKKIGSSLAIGGLVLNTAACSVVPGETRTYNGISENAAMTSFVGETQARTIQDAVEIMCTPGHSYLEQYKLQGTETIHTKTSTNNGGWWNTITTPFSNATETVTASVSGTSGYNIEQCRADGIKYKSQGVRQMDELIIFNMNNDRALEPTIRTPKGYTSQINSPQDRAQTAEIYLTQMLSVKGHRGEPVGPALFVASVAQMNAIKAIGRMNDIKVSAYKRDLGAGAFWTVVATILASGGAKAVIDAGGSTVKTIGNQTVTSGTRVIDGATR